MISFLSKLLPLAADPMPPTHKAGSEFEGFFLRLESHSGRSSSSSTAATSSTSKEPSKPSRTKQAKSSPSRIPRLAKNAQTASSPLRRRKPRSSSTSSSSSSHSAPSDPPSPTPPGRRASNSALSSAQDPSQRDAMMLTQIDPIFDSPESYLSHPLASTHKSIKSNGKEKASTLPTSSPADLILVVCELQSAPVDQRICIYLRWIVHGEEPALHQSLYGKGADRMPENAKKKSSESFEMIKYIPSWRLKLGPKAGKTAVQAFRIDLPAGPDEGLETLGFLQVTGDGNVVVDMTLPNSDQEGRGTRVRVRSTKHNPWHAHSPSSREAMGSKGPEGWIQHLGPILPLHWYVHTSSAPALFSLEHVMLGQVEGGMELSDAIAAGRGLLHVEKNWGHGFPSGWMWAHGATPLPDPSIPSEDPTTPSVRLSLAGGSILGLTAFLVGIRIGEVDWNFTPPTALGPQHSFPSGKGKVHVGAGMRMYRNFSDKTFILDVWDLTRWATIHIWGDEETFATQIPGPCPGGWKPGYCHHSYRCRGKVTLRTRTLVGLALAPAKAVLRPWKAMQSGVGWKKVVEVELDDRVALEFGGDFAQ